MYTVQILVQKPPIPLDFETKLVFPKGWGSPTKNLPCEGYGYFLDLGGLPIVGYTGSPGRKVVP